MTTPAIRLGPTSLRKRNGNIVPFDLYKIQQAVTAAGDGTDEFGPAMAWMLAHAVEGYLADLKTLDTAQVQDMVERQLMEAGYFRTARAFILQGERQRVERLAAGL